MPSSILQAEVSLGDLLDLESFSELCRSFAQLYRVGLKVFDASGNQLVDVRVGNEDFCGYIWRRPDGRSRCIATIGRVKGDGVAEEARPTTFDCFSGCRYAVQPVMYEGDVIGRIVFGPFVPEALVSLPTALTSISSDFDEHLATAYQRKIRRVSQPTAERILSHFGDLLDVLVFTGHKNLLTARLHIEAVQESYREQQEKSRQIDDSQTALKEIEWLKALLRPVTSILDVSRIDAGRVRLAISEVDVGQVMREAAATVMPLARGKKLKVTWEPSPLPRLRCDRGKIRECLIHLLSNAIKFTPPGGHVLLAARPLPGDRVALVVSDTGVGIGADHLPRVFDVFYQVAPPSAGHGGLGLGLAIVKSYVAAHGGEVEVESVVGKGTSFTVILPLRAGAADGPSLDQPPGRPRVGVASNGEGFAVRGPEARFPDTRG